MRTDSAGEPRLGEVGRFPCVVELIDDGVDRSDARRVSGIAPSELWICEPLGQQSVKRLRHDQALPPPARDPLTRRTPVHSAQACMLEGSPTRTHLASARGLCDHSGVGFDITAKAAGKARR